MRRQTFLTRFKLLAFIAGEGEEPEQNFLKDMAQIIKTKGAYAGEYLYRRDCISQPVLYLSEYEQVCTQREEINHYVRHGDWALIGMREFFIDKRTLFDVVVKAPVILDYILKEEFEPIVRKYGSVFEKYSEWLQGIKVERGSTDSLELRCWFCSGDHLQEDCQRLFGWRKAILLKGSCQEVPTLLENSVRAAHFRKRLSQELIKNKSHASVQADCLYSFRCYFSSFSL
jgi:hypothetical protein